MKENKTILHMEHWQLISLCMTFYDAVAVAFSYLFALMLRFDMRFSQIPEEYYQSYIKFIPFYIVICLVIFRRLKLYNSVWRFASFNELERVILATILTVPLHVILTLLFVQRMPISYYIVGAILQFGTSLFIRFLYRFILLFESRRNKYNPEAGVVRIMLIGAGQAGQLILRDIIRQKETKEKVVCIIDDNRNKWNRDVEGVRIVGGRDDILANVKKYQIQKIYLAIPSASASDRREILNICKETNCELKSLPGIYQLTTGEVTTSQLRNVSVEDLLGRDVISVDVDEIAEYIRGKVVLVTGGGGSIGSELCRQIASHNPEKLIVFDVYENNAYDIQQELKRKYPYLNLIVLIGSVRDSRRISSVFEKYRPDIVYHAAAHKHVPLMEYSPCEAIKNNVIGTYKTAYAAMKYGTDRFVLISTDKAVNPANIMGASKRLCEMVIQTMDRVGREKREYILPFVHAHTDNPDDNSDMKMRAGSSHTRFVAVRFGNVLGSNGSVIPLFKKQIEEGGPVTVTHPDIIRYFMTIPEAVSLVLQAGAYAGNATESRIYVLDMGEPVKIDTLARNLIKLSGLEPDEDIKIVYTGLRPGEKLYEEKLMDEEGIEKTPNDLIHIGRPIPLDTNAFLTNLEQLANESYRNSSKVEELVSEMVPTFHHKE